MFGRNQSIVEQHEGILFLYLAEIGFNMVSNAIEKYGNYRLSCCVWIDTGVIKIGKYLRLNECMIYRRTCTKKLIGNVPREEDSSWTSTIVDSKVFKWSPNAVQWPVNLIIIKIEI